MTREHPASKTQLRAAIELGIDTSDTPGYTTLGARLESAGWNAKGTGPLGEDEMPVAAERLESQRRWAQMTRKQKLAFQNREQMRDMPLRDQDGERTPDDQSNFGRD